MAMIDYPKHPEPGLMHKIEFELMPILNQEKPIPAPDLYHQFETDFEISEKKYAYYRLEVEGIASKVQPDVHNKPSIELSDCEGGKCFVLCVFNDPAILQKYKPGEVYTISGNYLIASSLYGIVLKNAEVKETNHE